MTQDPTKSPKADERPVTTFFQSGKIKSQFLPCNFVYKLLNNKVKQSINTMQYGRYDEGISWSNLKCDRICPQTTASNHDKNSHAAPAPVTATYPPNLITSVSDLVYNM